MCADIVLPILFHRVLQTCIIPGQAQIFRPPVPALTSGIICLMQYLMHHFTVGSDAFQISILEFDVDSEVDFQPLLTDLVQDLDGQISSYSYAVNGTTTHYSVTLKSKKAVTMEIVNDFSRKNPGIRAASASKL